MFRRILKILARCLLLFVVVSVVLVVTFRFVSPPTSGVMLQRYVQSLSAPGSYSTAYQWVALDKIAPVMGVAVVAAEDQLFAEHFGFDWDAIAKAVAHNEHSKRTRGASTISQQMVKNLFLWDGRTWVRKGLEAWFTLLVEIVWPKERILEAYLNIVEFGDGVFGVEAAAQRYFHKSASQLRPQEAALLAAVLPNPHLYRVTTPSPYVRSRQLWIQRQMQQLGGAAYLQELEQPTQ